MATAVLALDLGFKCGWAIGHDDGRLEYGVKTSLNYRGDGARFQAFRNFLHVTKQRLDMNQTPLRFIFYERVDFMRPGQVYAAHAWGAHWGALLAWAFHHEITTFGVATATLKKRISGRGHATKPQVIKAVNEQLIKHAAERKLPPFPEVTDDNAADALAILLTRDR